MDRDMIKTCYQTLPASLSSTQSSLAATIVNFSEVIDNDGDGNYILCVYTSNHELMLQTVSNIDGSVTSKLISKLPQEDVVKIISIVSTCPLLVALLTVTETLIIINFDSYYVNKRFPIIVNESKQLEKVSLYSLSGNNDGRKLAKLSLEDVLKNAILISSLHIDGICSSNSIVVGEYNKTILINCTNGYIVAVSINKNDSKCGTYRFEVALVKALADKVNITVIKAQKYVDDNGSRHTIIAMKSTCGIFITAIDDTAEMRCMNSSDGVEIEDVYDVWRDTGSDLCNNSDNIDNFLPIDACVQRLGDVDLSDRAKLLSSSAKTVVSFLAPDCYKTLLRSHNCDIYETSHIKSCRLVDKIDVLSDASTAFLLSYDINANVMYVHMLLLVGTEVTTQCCHSLHLKDIIIPYIRRFMEQENGECTSHNNSNNVRLLDALVTTDYLMIHVQSNPASATSKCLRYSLIDLLPCAILDSPSSAVMFSSSANDKNHIFAVSVNTISIVLIDRDPDALARVIERSAHDRLIDYIETLSHSHSLNAINFAATNDVCSTVAGMLLPLISASDLKKLVVSITSKYNYIHEVASHDELVVVITALQLLLERKAADDSSVERSSFVYAFDECVLDGGHAASSISTNLSDSVATTRLTLALIAHCINTYPQSVSVLVNISISLMMLAFVHAIFRLCSDYIGETFVSLCMIDANCGDYPCTYGNNGLDAVDLQLLNVMKRFNSYLPYVSQSDVYHVYLRILRAWCKLNVCVTILEDYVLQATVNYDASDGIGKQYVSILVHLLLHEVNLPHSHAFLLRLTQWCRQHTQIGY